jgi:DNA replication protein DnaC
MILPFLERKANSLLLYSMTVGSRKSSLAAAVLKSWRILWPAMSGYGGYFAYITPEMLQTAARDFTNGQVKLKDWKEKPILVLDDLGAIRNTPHLVETVCTVIGTRYDNMRPTIVTANLDPKGISEFVDPRVSSRIQEGVVINMGEVDWRLKE